MCFCVALSVEGGLQPAVDAQYTTLRGWTGCYHGRQIPGCQGRGTGSQRVTLLLLLDRQDSAALWMCSELGVNAEGDEALKKQPIG